MEAIRMRFASTSITCGRNHSMSTYAVQMHGSMRAKRQTWAGDYRMLSSAKWLGVRRTFCTSPCILVTSPAAACIPATQP
eukprot:7367-Eustigmatos_ZCMA.PRE.1